MSYNFSEDDFVSFAKKQERGLIFKKISSDIITPVLASLKISQKFPNHHFLFESVEKGIKKSRFSAIGFMPDLVWKSENRKSFINRNFDQNQENFNEEEGDVISNLRNLIKESQIDWKQSESNLDNIPGICSGIFGYMSYDMVRLMENIPNNNLHDELKIPDSIFIRPQILVIFDNLLDCAIICAPFFSIKNSAESTYQKLIEKISIVENLLSQPYQDNKKSATTNYKFLSNCSESEYCKMVEKAKEYIKNGDIFQVLPSQRFSADFDQNISEFSFYRSLRSLNPSPFLFYFKFADFVLTGSSPEIMVSLKDKKVTVRPLAGTRKRGKSEDEDKKISQELLNDHKEVAEHLMLIDLGRNDVGRVSEEKSVKVTEKMIIEKYSHVMHISSNVEGILRDDLDALDALIATFPAGTVSGAPKIRAMEIIEELEKIKRSFYSGCVGYFASNGDMETCITLRSALIKDKKIYLQSGAGVVFDSDPKSEYQECFNKAQALIKAYELAIESQNL
jgi:anthranilate synthase component 1